MQVQQIMNQPAIVCHPNDTADVAVKLMAENDCGVIPVVDDTNKVVGIVTDRDICMAAYGYRTPMHTFAVKTAMNETLTTCRPTDSLEMAAMKMKTARVHRLPVVDGHNRIVGVISTNDIFRQVGIHRDQEGLSDQKLVETLAAICSPRRPVQLVEQPT